MICALFLLEFLQLDERFTGLSVPITECEAGYFCTIGASRTRPRNVNDENIIPSFFSKQLQIYSFEHVVNLAEFSYDLVEAYEYSNLSLDYLLTFISERSLGM